MCVAKIPQSKLKKVRELYYVKKYSMRAVGKKLGASLDCVAYFMRKNGLKRRTLKEGQNAIFAVKKASFKIRENNKKSIELDAIGAMLYWGEGYKGSIEYPAKILDFTNSDPDMILLFLTFLRNRFKLDENKFRVLLYCYSDQSVPELVSFWSQITKRAVHQTIC
jgi:hypothetical protein